VKLIKAKVENFKSIEDSGEFKVETDGNITCFVGKNESGKTNLLQALYRLNPIFALPEPRFDPEPDYPRRFLTDYSERHPEEDARAVTTWWELEPEEVAAIEEQLGTGAVNSSQVQVSRDYKAEKNTWSVAFNQEAIVRHLVSKAELHEEERKGLAAAKTIPQLSTLVGTPGDDSPRLHALAEHIKAVAPKQSPYGTVCKVLDLPKFMLVSQYQRMDGQVSLDQVLQKKTTNKLNDNDQVFIALCEMAGTSIEEAAAIAKFEQLVAKFEGASNKISSEIFKYWSQNRFLKVQFRLDMAQPQDPAPFNSGKIVRTRILNTLHEVTVPFDDRSTGFVWFFSFLALFSQVKKRHQGQLVLLLDEPGLTLHGRAQGDLLRYFKERLAPHHQVLYTTHSPFMVPTENILVTRTVEDVVIHRKDEAPEVKGTKVGSEVLSTDQETLFPLQGALGYELSQSLFVGEHTLVVEGPSDLLYLKAISEELKSRDRTALDPRWTVCPAGSIDKVPAVLSLFGGNKLHVATFVDFAQGQKQKIERLRREGLLRDGHVLTAEQYADQAEADTEDVLGAELYAEIVNACYGLAGDQAFQAPTDGGRVVKHAEAHFRGLPSTVPAFSHFTPSTYLIENRSHLLKGKKKSVTTALDRFEKLFQDLNALL
jgi:predicted ATP-dependent endonuclease of OLD family